MPYKVIMPKYWPKQDINVFILQKDGQSFEGEEVVMEKDEMDDI